MPQKSGYLSDNWASLDGLNYGVYQSALLDILQNGQTPLTVGVFGTWGSGKTTLLRLLKGEIDKDQLNNAKPSGSPPGNMSTRKPCGAPLSCKSSAVCTLLKTASGLPWINWMFSKKKGWNTWRGWNAPCMKRSAGRKRGLGSGQRSAEKRTDPYPFLAGLSIDRKF